MAYNDIRGSSYSSKRRRVLLKVEDHLAAIFGDKECCDIAEPHTSTSNQQYEHVPSVVATATVNISNQDCGAILPLDESQLVDNSDLNTCSDLNISLSQYFSETASDDSVSGSTDEDCYGKNLAASLADWALHHNIDMNSLKSLLNILIAYHPDLPKDPRTLLKKEQPNSTVALLSGGHYYHFGLGAGILQEFALSSVSITVSDSTLHVQINIDGLPIFKSTNYQVWPISAILLESQTRSPFVVGIYGGVTKPGSVDEYLEQFVAEAALLNTDGLRVDNKLYKVEIHSIVCDAPARAFLKKVKSHSGYDSCERCRQRGEYCTNKVIFPEFNCNPRMDISFANGEEEEHQLGVSPLNKLGLGLVSQFPLDYVYMHLVCLGVVRRLLLSWLQSSLKCRAAIKTG